MPLAVLWLLSELSHLIGLQSAAQSEGIFLPSNPLYLECLFLFRYAYFLLTRQEYLYPDAADRQRLMLFHKKAKKHRWDVEKYNRLKQVEIIKSFIR